ncbi:hypothetical protein L3Y34_007588 [Caenorhabditis briggsae]|uniref:Sodium/calcium exchanger membrane region domain-containing protein n=1 Tax=Caenorhabditis briggsae TaxID=6238 RepID=A0AAE9D126_CAEBR|nr:hypothetical protein L3Y34_007588 [Caenorhabditis briggsae]
MERIKWIVFLISVISVGAQYNTNFDYQNVNAFPSIPSNMSMYPGMPFGEEQCSSDKCSFETFWTSEGKLFLSITFFNAKIFSEKCAYIKCNPDACEGGGYLEWSMYVKCQHDTGLRVLYIILAVIWLAFCFIVVSTIADDFFCPSISGIVTHLRMSESVAGVTFLAFGNGAPDVLGSFTSVLTTAKPKADLALGDLFGTSIFVTTVVLAIVILTKSFRVAIIPTLRDLIFYLITLAFIVFCFLKFDRVEVWMSATFIGIYVVYVITVIIFGCYRSRRKKINLKKKSLESGEEDLSRPASAASVVPIYGEVDKKKASMSALFNFMIKFSQFVKGLAIPNNQRKIHDSNNNEKKMGIPNIAFDGSLDSDISAKPKISDIFQQNTFETDVESETTLDEIEDSGDEGREEEFAYAHHTVFTSHDQISLAATEIPEIKLVTWRSWDWVWDLFNHLKSWPSREEFSEMNIFVKIISIIRIVPVFFFKATIPSNEMSWCKPLCILHCFASIQLVLFAFQITNLKIFAGSPGLWLYALAVSAILALLALYFLPLSKEPKYHKEVYSYLGFVMSIAWIYANSNEIISAVTMFGVVTGLSQELLGLTVMSWSDCIGDIVADIAVVKQGYPKMAMAAVIGGPLFNLLIGFGVPFTIAAAQGKQIDLIINPVYRILLLFLGISLVTTFVALFIQRFTVRWPHAVLLILIFVTFVVFVCLAEFHVLEWK